MKKLLAIFVTIIMVATMSLPTISVFADEAVETPDYSDNASIDKGNLIKDPDNITHLSNNNYVGTFAETVSGSHITWQDYDVPDEVDYAGFIAGPTRLAYTSGGNLMGHFVDGFDNTNGWTKGDTFVYSIRLKNAAPDKDASPLFGMAFSWYRDAEDNNALVTFEVENADEYKTYTGYWTSQLESKNHALSLGIAYPDAVIPYTATGAQISMDISNGGSLLVAKEAATEITNEVVGNSVITPGGTATIKAEVLNQIGEKGNIAQNISYIALNSDRSDEMAGFTFTNNADGTVTVSVADSVTAGKYVVLAVHDDESAATGLQKGADIVVGGYADYEAPTERTDNLIQAPGNLSLYQQTGTEAVTVTQGTDTSEAKYTYVGIGGAQKWGNSGYYSVEGTWSGAYRSGSINDMSFNGYLPTGPENYVVEMQVRNLAPSLDTAPEFAVTVFADRAAESWNNRRIFTVTETDNWQTCSATISTQKVGATNFIFGLGYPTTEYPVLNTSIALKMSSMYVAIEKAFDMNVTGTTSVAPGGNMSLQAEVLNQIGTTGNLTQDFAWTALNADRSAAVEGFSFTKGEDGAVNVTVNESVQPGSYVILAAHTDDSSIESGIQKGIEVTVEPPVVTDANVTVSSGNATFSSATVENLASGAEIMFIIASYDEENNKLVDVDFENVTASNGTAALTEAIAIAAEDGNTVKIFAWHASSIKPIKFADNVQNKWE